MMNFPTLFLRAIRLRCPRCGEGRLYRSIVSIKMNKRCANCNLQFERESGFFLGAIYINYGLTAAIVTVGYMVLLVTRALPHDQIKFVTLSVAVIFPLLFFRHARSLWLAFDFMVDPRDTDQETGSEWHETAEK